MAAKSGEMVDTEVNKKHKCQLNDYGYSHRVVWVIYLEKSHQLERKVIKYQIARNVADEVSLFTSSIRNITSSLVVICMQ